MHRNHQLAATLALVLASGVTFMTNAAAAATQMPYTAAQAKSGLTVYSSQCASCHGANLQGVAAPAIAGKDFLQTAQSNKWSLQTIDQIVVNNMPFSAPGSLKPKQYADVMAYLLAANCYKAGSKPFPTTAPASFANVQIKPFSATNSGADKNGVCSVKP
jgi:polar amino acid transport system substrate-binding protein